MENKSFEEIKRIVEALLFSVHEPIPIRKMVEIIEDSDQKQIKEAISQLGREYDSYDRAFQIEEIANGFQLLSRPEYHEWVSKLVKKKNDGKLSQSSLETLAIIAYKQPIIRADIEAIRGVQSGQIIRTLIEKDLVKIAGRDEVLGRPLLYGTTRKFLEHFSLNSINDLPKVEELEMP
ncbi:MAG: SMC-Scp complex subunit ScpB [Planctomycetes bacterium]|nr:SMC-Scp complex subunit ScpB [Planctomycetota bacterium]